MLSLHLDQSRLENIATQKKMEESWKMLYIDVCVDMETRRADPYHTAC